MMKRSFALMLTLVAFASCLGKEPQAASSLALNAPAGKLLHGVFIGGGEEEDPTPARLERYENAVEKKAAWVYFSNNWFTSRAFPQTSSESIRKAGSVPFIRLMLRSSTDIDVPETKFTLEKINAGDFDTDLKAWGDAAKAFKTPLIVEFGTEVNGKWFSWNGFWHGANTDGPKKFREAYRRIIQLIRARGATNITWVFHVAGDDDPNESWNKLENYYPAQEPTASDVEDLVPQLDRIMPRLEKLAPGKPIMLLEFGLVTNHPDVNAATWTAAGLDAMLANRWPALRGFAWWNSRWPNDSDPNHDSRMLVEDAPEVAKVLRERLKSDRMLERLPN
jgi:hypothetical protein